MEIKAFLTLAEIEQAINHWRAAESHWQRWGTVPERSPTGRQRRGYEL
ncbi:hypothetical protein [Paraburkholderia sp. JHI869]